MNLYTRLRDALMFGAIGAVLVSAAYGTTTINGQAIVGQYDPTYWPFSMKCDGTTDDTTAWQTAVSSGDSLKFPPGRTCLAYGATTQSHQTIDLNGSTIQAPSSDTTGQPVITLSGIYSSVFGGIVTDPNGRTEVSTTTTSAPSNGATSIPVSSINGVTNGMPIFIKTQGANNPTWHSKVAPTGSITTGAVPLTDPIPDVAASAVVNAGGSGCSASGGANSSFVVLGGYGAPATGHVTSVSGGTVTGVQLDASGFYLHGSTPGTTGVTVQFPANQGCTGVTINITYATNTIANGATVEVTSGVIAINGAAYGGLAAITIPSAPMSLGVFNTSATTANPTAQLNVVAVNGLANTLTGLWLDAGVYNSNFDRDTFYGTTHNGSVWGVVGLERNYELPTNSNPSGGNHFTNVQFLGFEEGAWDRYGNNDFFDAGFTVDSNAFYDFVCDGCYTNTFTSSLWSSFTGPNSNTGTAFRGVGLYAGHYSEAGAGSPQGAINNNLVNIPGGANAADVYFGDYTGDGEACSCGASFTLTGNTLPQLKISANSNALIFAHRIMRGLTPTVGSVETVYFADGAPAASVMTTEGQVNVPSEQARTVTGFGCASTLAPGAGQTYTCKFKDGGASMGQCVISGASATGCTYPGPGFAIGQGDQIDFEMDMSGSAATSVQFRGYAYGY